MNIISRYKSLKVYHQIILVGFITTSLCLVMALATQVKFWYVPMGLGVPFIIGGIALQRAYRQTIERPRRG